MFSSLLSTLQSLFQVLYVVAEACDGGLEGVDVFGQEVVRDLVLSEEVGVDGRS